MSAMQKIRLPHTELDVSELCLGTNMFGTATPQAQAEEILNTFAALGGNFLDTAHSYGDWIPDAPRSASEHAIGAWLQKTSSHKKRKDFVLATKGCEFDYRAGDFALRVTPELLEQDLLGSLAALQTDYIDLYWLHRDDSSKPVQAIVDALIAHQKAGRIRYFGCSNWSVERIQEAQNYARSLGNDGFVACQPLWGLAVPDRNAMLKYCPGGYYEDGYQALHKAGLTMIPYSSQSRGFFSKVASGGRAALSPDLAELYYSDENLRKLEAVKTRAAHYGVGINDIVLAYLTSQPLPTIPIIGCSRSAQLRESVNACALQLDLAELQLLRQA
jgi:aryl-alcohol dehydrogenase-like predicted oxidoreductase